MSADDVIDLDAIDRDPAATDRERALVAEVRRLRGDLAHYEHMAQLVHAALGCGKTHARGAEIVCALGRADLRLPEHAALVYRACDLPDDLRALLADHLDDVAWVAEYRETSAVRALTRGHNAAWLALDGRHFVLWTEAPCPLCNDETPEVR